VEELEMNTATKTAFFNSRQRESGGVGNEYCTRLTVAEQKRQ